MRIISRVAMATVVVLTSFSSPADASVGGACRKAGVVDQQSGNKCVRRRGRLVWVKFYSVPGRPEFVQFSASTGALSWGNPLFWGNPVATNFVIQMRTTKALDWVTMVETTINNRSATVSNIESGVGYEFRVAARNPFGIGEFTNSGLSNSAPSTTVARPSVASTTTTTTPSGTTATTVARTVTSTTATTVSSGSNMTTSQAQAVRSASSYLRYSGFSRSGLIKQLEYEGFSSSDAAFGVDAQNANWTAQATRVGASYLRTMAFSRNGLVKQLEYEGFSSSDAASGADSQNADWFAQAAKMAASYLRSSSFSRSGLINQLIYEGFTQAQAEYGASSVGL